jgi:hypothetical protein
MTRNDLQRKTAVQLAALFKEATAQLGRRDKRSILMLIAMIRAEQQHRGPAP